MGQSADRILFIDEQGRELWMSSLEYAWETLRLQLASDIPVLEREYQFYPKRKWRLDKAWVDQKIYIELQGGTWTRGGHSRGAGQTRDCEKLNMLTLMGWRGLLLTTDMLHGDPDLHFSQLRKLLELDE